MHSELVGRVCSVYDVFLWPELPRCGSAQGDTAILLASSSCWRVSGLHVGSSRVPVCLVVSVVRVCFLFPSVFNNGS